MWPDEEPPSSGTRRWGPPASVLLAGIVLTAVTWNRWVDPQVDFGRELYMAWRVAEGDVLYRDLASFSGPLSPAINGALFRIVGPGIQGLLLLNMLVLLVVTTLSYRLLASVVGGRPAAAACASFLGVCAFGHSSGYSVFNFLAPYSHELTHGVLVGLVGLACLDQAERRETIGPLAGAGLCAGLSLLLKPEIALATVASLGVGAVVLSRLSRGSVRGARALVPFTAGLLVPPLAYLAVSALSGHGTGATGLVWPWAAALQGEVRGSPYVRGTLGLDAPLRNVAAMVGWSAIWMGLVVGASRTTRRFPASLRRRRTIGLWWFALVAPVALALALHGPWNLAFTPLGFLLAGLLARGVRGAVQRPPTATALQISGVLFALLLLAKLGLAPRVWGYGFALAAPAVMIGVAWLLGPLPRHISADPFEQSAARGTATALLLVVCGLHLAVFQFRFLGRDFALGEGSDRVRVDPVRGQALSGVLEDLDSRPRSAGEPLLVVPEGVFLNYLVRRPTPSPVLNYMPIELTLFPEREVLDRLRNRRPADVIELPKDVRNEYGVEFGISYAEAIGRWLAAEYQESGTFGGGSFGGRPFVVRHLTPRPPSQERRGAFSGSEE